MNLIAFTTTWWEDKAHAASKQLDLRQWESRVNYAFAPKRIFLATASDPEFNPLPHIEIVPRGFKNTKPYDPIRWCYFLCDLCAMLQHAYKLGCQWDLMVHLETDYVFNAPNVYWGKIINEFLSRPESICSPAWAQVVECSFVIWKRRAVPKFLQNRKRANLVEGDGPVILAEQELAEIFAGDWWNPWPEIGTMRQEAFPGSKEFTPDEIAKKWPVVGRPSDFIRKHAVI